MFSTNLLTSLIEEGVYDEKIKSKEPSYSDWTSSSSSLKEKWKTDGQCTVKKVRNGIEIFSEKQKSHHVLWFPYELKNNFVVTFRVKNCHVKAGLLMILFHARGLKGESVFDRELVKDRRRKSEFHHYKTGLLSMYSISYYANTPAVPNRGRTHLRKNPAQNPVKKVDGGISSSSVAWHVVTIVCARAGKIEFWIDDHLILSYKEKEDAKTKPYMSGWLGFRQMKWSHFAYSDLKIWDWGGMARDRDVKQSMGGRSCVCF